MCNAELEFVNYFVPFLPNACMHNINTISTIYNIDTIMTIIIRNAASSARHSELPWKDLNTNIFNDSVSTHISLGRPMRIYTLCLQVPTIRFPGAKSMKKLSKLQVQDTPPPLPLYRNDIVCTANTIMVVVLVERSGNGKEAFVVAVYAAATAIGIQVIAHSITSIRAPMRNRHSVAVSLVSPQAMMYRSLFSKDTHDGTDVEFDGVDSYFGRDVIKGPRNDRASPSINRAVVLRRENKKAYI